MFFIYGGLATFLVAISNTLIINSTIFGVNNSTIKTAIFISIQIVVSLLFLQYYSKGYSSGESYPVLVIFSYGLGIFFSLVIQKFVLPSEMNLTESIGSMLIIIGILFVAVGHNIK